MGRGNANEAFWEQAETRKRRRRNDDEVMAAKKREQNLCTRIEATRIWWIVVIGSKKAWKCIEKDKNMALNGRQGTDDVQFIGRVKEQHNNTRRKKAGVIRAVVGQYNIKFGIATKMNRIQNTEKWLPTTTEDKESQFRSHHSFS